MKVMFFFASQKGEGGRMSLFFIYFCVILYEKQNLSLNLLYLCVFFFSLKLWKGTHSRLPNVISFLIGLFSKHDLQVPPFLVPLFGNAKRKKNLNMGLHGEINPFPFSRRQALCVFKVAAKRQAFFLSFFFLFLLHDRSTSSNKNH